MREKILHLIVGLAGVLLVTVLATGAVADTVKLSKGGICHDEASRWYSRTKSFTAFDTMSACLSHGRAYSGYDGQDGLSGESAAVSSPRADGGTKYDRDLYDHWIDEDQDCMNTRHELLEELSTGRVTRSGDGCYVIRGRWNDPYTGNIYMTARDMDVDHMVPLAWAHCRGAHSWGAEKRRRFANDPVNLFAVQASANRSKGARGPLEWMPPNEAFHCQYVIRFERIVRLYRLDYRPGEKSDMDALRARVCGYQN